MDDFNIIEKFDLTNTKRVLDEYAKKFEELLKKKIVEKDKVASHQLLDSIEVNVVKPNGDEYTVVLNAQYYLKFVEQGVNKNWWPPKEPILKWVKNKKLPTKESTGDKSLPTEKQLSYLVRKKIAGELTKNGQLLPGGIKPTPMVAETQEELNAKYIPIIKEALIFDIKRCIPQIHVSLRFD